MAYVFPTLTGSISSKFGDSRDGGSRSHAGVDVALPVGSDVLSMAAGRVTYTGYNSQRGNYMKVDNQDGTQSIYQHLSAFNSKVGDYVNAGQKIALSGNSGVGTGPHLHFELLRNGTPIDPLSVAYGQAHSGGGRSFAGPDSSSGSGEQILEALKEHWILIAGALVIIAILAK